VVGVIWASAIAVDVVLVLVFSPRAGGCTSCAWEPAPLPSRPAYTTALWAYQRAGFVLVLLFFAAVWLRWRRATRAERLVLAPLWVAVSIIAVVYLMGAFASPFPDADPFAYLIWELQGVLQVSLPIVFVWGLLSTRLARSAVGDLMVELERPQPPGELQASLARALGDPSLELRYAREGQDGWVDARGQPGTLPGPGAGPRARTVTMVERQGRPLAALIHDPALDQGLVRAAAAAAGMTIENERLHAEVRAQLEEVRASRQRIVEAGDRERRRVERNLHDGAQQRLATLALSLAMIRDRDGADPAAAALLAEASAELKQAIGELRELARGIHPAILTEEGLPAAVESLADRSALPVRVLADFEARLPEPVEAVAYFVVSESLANVAKYARASSAQVEMSRCNATLRVEVLDNGIGGADAARGSGLRGLEDRVAAVRGRFCGDPRVRGDPGAGRDTVRWLSPAPSGSCWPTTRCSSARAWPGCSPSTASP
jgi:signal transduction histidine kinase